MKKLFAVLLAALMIASLSAVHAFAGALNPDNGCKVEAQVKRAAPGAVVHDGVISQGEYNEIEINRDSDVTDMLLTWNGSGEGLLSACEFLKSVHFYASWDENGINLAAQGTLLEDPYCNGTYPDTLQEYEGKQYVGDEFFAFNFGCIFKIENPDDWDMEYLYRSLGVNTETGEILVGAYWADGLTGSLTLTEGKDYYVGINGRTVTYEITLPFESSLKADQLNGSLPVDGADFYFTISLTGGSQDYDAGTTYAVSLGDGGYMTTRRIISDYSGALGVISMEPVVETETETDPGPDTEPPEETEPGTGTEPGTTSTEPGATADPENPGQNPVEDPDETPVSGQQPGQTTVAPRTGDPMLLIAAVSALSAGAALVIKKRKF